MKPRQISQGLLNKDNTPPKIMIPRSPSTALSVAVATVCILINPKLSALPSSQNADRPITHKIQIQGIRTQQAPAQGGNIATGFGTSEQQDQINIVLDDIYRQAGIDIEILPTYNYISSSAYNGHQDGQVYDPNVIRPADDFISVFQDPFTPLSTNLSALNLIFVDHMPGRTRSSSELSTSATAFSDANGIMLFVGADLLTFDQGINIVAQNLARQIGFNLGLSESNEFENLMQPLGSPEGGTRIEQSQIDTMFTDNAMSIMESDGIQLLQAVEPIPEPTTPILLATGVLAFTLRRKK